MNYKRALPGRRFVKFILSLALVWGILALVYLFIPSFNPKDTTITGWLEFDDERITRVYESDQFFKSPPCHNRYPWPGVPDEECPKVELPPALQRFLNQWTSHLIFELKLSEKNRVQYLSLAGGSDPLTKLPFDLYTPLTGTEIPLNFEGLSRDDNATISEPLSIRVASTRWSSGELTPKWFSVADTALINWWYESHRSIEVPLRILRDPFKGILEVWPEHWDWADFAKNQTTPSNTRPLISVKIPYLDNRARFFDSLPEYPISSSPTPYTLQARVILLLFLIPVGILWYGLIIIVSAPFSIGVGIFSFIITLLVNILAFLVVAALIYAIVWWFRNGRPPVAELGRKSGVRLHGQWGRPAPSEGETVTYTYGLSVSVNRTPAASQPVSLNGPERDLEAGTGTPESETAVQAPSTFKGKHPASQED